MFFLIMAVIMAVLSIVWIVQAFYERKRRNETVTVEIIDDDDYESGYEDEYDDRDE
jgi:hypothetical protein